MIGAAGIGIVTTSVIGGQVSKALPDIWRAIVERCLARFIFTIFK